MESKLISTLLLLSSLLPIAYLILASGKIGRIFNDPTAAQVYHVLRFRWHLLGSGFVLWLAGIVVLSLEASTYSWMDSLSVILLLFLTAVGLYMLGNTMFPPVTEAQFLTSEDVKALLSPDDPIIGLEINGETRAYPIKWLRRPKIVEDVVGDTPLVITYCDPCKEARVFSTEFEGSSLRLIFPNHREHDLMLYDAGGRRLVQQHSGEIIFGPGRGQKLSAVPVRVVPWVTWETLHPNCKVFYYETDNKNGSPHKDLKDRLKLVAVQTSAEF
jgi:hypothetical protein